VFAAGLAIRSLIDAEVDSTQENIHRTAFGEDEVLAQRDMNTWDFTPISPVLNTISSVVLHPIGEEIVFRGMFYRHLLTTTSPAVAIVGSSLLFGAAHIDTARYIPISETAGGVLCALAYYATGRLVVPIALHMANNAICDLQHRAVTEMRRTVAKVLAGQPHEHTAARLSIATAVMQATQLGRSLAPRRDDQGPGPVIPVSQSRALDAIFSHMVSDPDHNATFREVAVAIG
jgi:hypothetical protein